MIERSRRVVLLIDYDNLQICASRDTPGRDLQLAPVVQLAQHYGTVILARAYAEWNLSTERLAVYKAGIEPAFAPVLRTEGDRSGKSLADTVMVAEGMDMLWTLSPEVVVLATSDKDLIPLVRVAKQRGAFVVVLGSDFTAIPLREMADEHVTYRQLITDASGRFTADAGAGRQPAALPETAHRRPRERNGRERAAATSAPTATPAVAAAPPPAVSPPPVRVERIEREPSPAVSAVEPVPQFTAGIAGDDAQGLGRRRRRRGSRRRSERVGLPGEGPLGAEGGSELDADLDATDATEESSALYERDETPFVLGEPDDDEPAGAYDTATPDTEPLEPDSVQTLPDEPEAPAYAAPQYEAPRSIPVEAAVPPATPAPRDRRRRSRRPAVTGVQDPLPSEPGVDTAGAAISSNGQSIEAPVVGLTGDDVVVGSSTPVDEVLVPLEEPMVAPLSNEERPSDLLPAGEPATPDGGLLGEAGEPVAEEAAPVRRTRSRRTTGPSAGRTRSTGR